MRALAGFALLACLLPAAASEAIWIPWSAGRLEATLYKPQGPGPFPLIIFSHGSTGGGGPEVEKRTLRPDWLAGFALERGVAVLAPMRRGRGRSEGIYSEATSCDPVRLEAGMRHAMEDLDAVVAFARSQPFVDQGRIILSGASRGGILSVVYASKREGIAAVVNFVGGWTGQGCAYDFNTGTFASAGRTRTPMLWLYGENDGYYSAEHVRRYAAAFEQAGGNAHLHIYPSGGGDGHFFYRRTAAWKAPLGELLDRIRR